MNRRHGLRLGLLAALPALGGALGACGTAAPPTRWYRLPTERPAQQPAPKRQTKVRHWELQPTVKLPELLQRDTLLAEEGAAGIRLLHGHRWAEPLRDAVPRLLRHDLGLWLPSVWTAPAPAGVAVAGRVQLDLLAWQGSLTLRQVRLAARWVVTPGPAAQPGQTPRAWQADLRLPWAAPDTDALVLALRAALWQLAEDLAASLDQA